MIKADMVKRCFYRSLVYNPLKLELYGVLIFRLNERRVKPKDVSKRNSRANERCE
jgi:hypothetical protein